MRTILIISITIYNGSIYNGWKKKIFLINEVEELISKFLYLLTINTTLLMNILLMITTIFY